MKKNTNRIVTVFMFLFSFNSSEARPLIEIQKDIQYHLDVAFNTAKIYENNLSCTLKNGNINTISIPENNNKDIHIIFYSLKNVETLRDRLPHQSNYLQMMPIDVDYIKELFENSLVLAQTSTQKDFFQFLQESINSSINKNECLIVTLHNGMKFSEFMTNPSDEFKHYIAQCDMNNYMEELIEDTGNNNYLGVEQAVNMMNIITLLVYLQNQINELPTVK